MIWQSVRGAVLQWSVRSTGLAVIATLTFYGLTWFMAGKIPNVWDEIVECAMNLRMIGDAIYRREFWDLFEFLWGTDVVPKNMALAKTYGFLSGYAILAARCCLMFAMFTASFGIAIEALTFLRYGVPGVLGGAWRRWREGRQKPVATDGFGGADFETANDARDRMRR